MFKTIKRGLRGWHNSWSHPEEVWGLVNRIEIAAKDEIAIPAGLKLTQEQARLVARAAARAAADASASRPRKNPPTILVNPKNIGDGTLAALREFTQHLSPENIIEDVDNFTRTLYIGDFRYGAKLPPVSDDPWEAMHEPKYMLREVIKKIPDLPVYMQSVAIGGGYPKAWGSFSSFPLYMLPSKRKQELLQMAREEYKQESRSTEAYKRDEAESKWKIRQRELGVSVNLEKEFHDRLERYIDVPVFPPLIWPESELVKKGLNVDAYRACNTIEDLKEYWKKTRYEERMKAHSKWAGVIKEQIRLENATPEEQYKVGLAYRGGKNGREKNEDKATYWLRKAADNGHLEAMFETRQYEKAAALGHERSKETLERIEKWARWPSERSCVSYSTGIPMYYDPAPAPTSAGYYPSRGGGSGSGSATHHPNGVPYAVMEGEMGRQGYDRIGNKRH